MHQNSCWLTLTFETDPGSIARRDLQLFFKRLRKAGHKFQYFACGEYGEKLSRPHYHVCLFGTDFKDQYAWKKSKGGLLYRSPELEKHWHYGHALISPLTPENSGYTARYTLKKINGDIADDHYKRDFKGYEISVTPEFILMSLKPAIGKKWIEKNWREVFPSDEIIYKGKKCPVPSYYLKWLKENHTNAYEHIVWKRQQFYKSQEYETGLRIKQAAQARDHKTATLDNRNFDQ